VNLKTGQSLSKTSKPTALHTEGTAQVLEWLNISDTAKKLYQGTANPTWGDIFESSKLKARTSLLPRFTEKRLSSFEL